MNCIIFNLSSFIDFMIFKVEKILAIFWHFKWKLVVLLGYCKTHDDIDTSI